MTVRLSLVRRLSVFVAIAAILTIGLGTSTAVRADAPFGGPWCAQNGNTAPCIGKVTLTIGTAAPRQIGPATDDYSVGIDNCTGCAGDIGWSTYSFGGAMPTDATWSIDVNVGTTVPSETDTWGSDVSVTRTKAGADSYVTISGGTVLTDDSSSCVQQADLSSLCQEQADSSVVQFGGDISDYTVNNTKQIADAAYGTDTWTNAGSTGAPEFDNSGSGQIEIPLGNTHFNADGSVAVGDYHAFVPDSTLELFGIDDPGTITPTSLNVAVQSGDVAVTPTATGVSIDITNISWPSPAGIGQIRADLASKTPRARVAPLRIKRGVITPTRPSHVRAHRSSASKGTLKVKGATPRGSRIATYAARCTAHHHRTVHVSGKHSKLKLRKLTRGVRYSCQARAVATAGAGRWSKPVTLRSH